MSNLPLGAAQDITAPWNELLIDFNYILTLIINKVVFNSGSIEGSISILDNQQGYILDFIDEYIKTEYSDLFEDYNTMHYILKDYKIH